MRIYHGSPAIIDDEYFSSGTYFTSDILLALEYGEYIYQFDVGEEFLDQTDAILGCYVSNCLFPTNEMIIFKVM